MQTVILRILTLYQKIMLVYQKERMIEEWKIRTGYGDFRRDCTVERDDGLDINAYIEQRINVCYRKLLREAPFALLPIKNFAGDVKMQVMPDLSGFIALPNDCLRVSEIRVSGWKRMVKSSEFAVGERAALQSNEWIRGGCVNPVVVEGHRSLTVYSVPDKSAVVELLFGVSCQEPGVYAFDEAAWEVLLQYDKEMS